MTLFRPMLSVCLGIALMLTGGLCARADVIISEFMALNNGPIADNDGDFSDWIELQNTGTNTVNLLGWHLTDKVDNLTKWTFPSVALLPGQFLLVYASEKDRRVAGLPLHTNFKLDGAGEYLALVRADGTTVESFYGPTYPQQYHGLSYGVAPDAHVWMVPAGADARILVPFFSIPTAWTDRLGFDDSSWLTGARGIGYQTPAADFAPYLHTTVTVTRATFCTRYTFDLTGGEDLDLLRLALRFDDGFVAFLNGVRVAESNAPLELTNLSTAMVTRAHAAAIALTEFDLTAFRGALEEGVNVLAIQALNVSPTDTDMLLEAQLYGESTNATLPLLYFGTPTPGAANATGLTEPAGEPQFSLPAGFYTNTQTLVLSASGVGAVIRYTLNGDEPTESSPAYTGPLNIASRVGQANVFAQIPTAPSGGQGQWSWMPRWLPPEGEVFKSTVVRARTFAPGQAPSPIVTQTYFVDTNMFARYGHLPVISLASDRKHLFDPATGIYVPGNLYSGNTASGNYYQRWEKPCNIEWFEPGGEVGFNQVVGIRIQGNSSVASPQKGISIFARAEYGEGSIKHPIFATVQGRARELTEFKRFMLRGWGSYRGRGLLYDPFSHILLDHTDLELQDYRPCVVFVNGEYWGLQEVREANKNSHYLEQYYEVDRNDPGYDVLYGSGPYSDFDPDNLTDYSYVDEGDATNWHAMTSFLSGDMSQPANYAHAKTLIDVDNYLLYMIHSGFTVKYDWPNQNEAKFRPRVDDARWRWLQFDMDHSFHDSWATDMMGKLRAHNIFSRLDDNPAFVYAFINLYADLMNTAFRRDVMLGRFDAMTAELAPFAAEWHARWPVLEGSGAQVARWNSWLQQMRNNIANRTGFERDNLRTAYGLGGNAALTLSVNDATRGRVRINTTDITPRTPGVTNGVPYPWEGIYYQGVPMQCTAIPEDGYQFIGWQGLSTSITNPLTFTLAGNASLTASFAPFNPEDFPLTISEIMYHPAAGEGLLASNEAEFVELHNRGSLPLNLRGVTFTEGIAFGFTNDFMLPAGGHVVLVNNLAAFTARYGTSGPTVGGVYAGQLSNSGEQLRLKATPWGPTLASFSYGDGREWPVTADGAGHSLVPLVPNNAADSRLSHGAYWRASAYRFGSPGASDPEPVVDVVLNEIVAHTDLDDPIHYPEYDSNDWLELFNLGETPRSLANWYLSDDRDNLKKWAIPADAVIEGQGWRIFDEVTGFHSPITNGFGLNKAGETVLLSYLPGTSADRVADAVAFKGQENGSSLGRYPDGASHWRTLMPTPAAANGAPALHVVISEIMAQPLDDAEGATNEFIEIWNPTAGAVLLQTESGPWRLDGGVSFVFPLGTLLPAGGYLAVVAFDPTNDPTARAAFLAAYGLTNGQVRLVGPYAGRLRNEGDRVALERPQPPDVIGEDRSWVIVDEVLYAPYAPWPASTAGTGRSIRRYTPDMAGVAPDAWLAELFPSPGLPPTKLALAAPEPGSEFLLPFTTTVAVAIDESQVTGSVLAVTFQLDGETLAVDTTAPYTCELGGLTDPQSYLLEAVMEDGAGLHAAAPSTIHALALDNAEGATDITETTARLQGRLTGTGTASVTLYWGEVDGGTNAAAWDHAVPLGAGIGGSFSRVVSGIVLGRTYYYRAFAANAHGTTWSPAATAFRSTYDNWPNALRITLRDLPVSETLIDFPVLIALSTNIPGFDYGTFGSPTGADLRFTLSTNETALAYEIEKWDVAGTSHVWVRMPALAPGDNALLALWGNPAALVPPSATNGSVWSASHARVLHLNGGMDDSSTNQVSAVDTGTVAVAGIVGEGRYFDGADDAIDPLLPPAWFGEHIQNLTLSLWVLAAPKENATAFGALGPPALDTSRLAITQAGGKWKFVVRTAGTANQEHAVDSNRWQMLTLVLDQGLARAYCDGVPASTTLAYVPFTPSRHPLLGMMGGQSLASYRLQGRMDEVRMASVAQSADWIRASYLVVASNALVTSYQMGHASSVDGDHDGDGLPDAWEEQHFGATNAPLGDVDADWDGDGASNSAEYQAGTDPTNVIDTFRVNLDWLPGAVQVSFYGVSADLQLGQQARYYVLESATNLADPAWMGVPSFTNVRGENAVVALITNTPPASAAREFYRGRVWVESTPP